MANNMVRKIVLLFLVLDIGISYTALAQTQQPISNYQAIHGSMVAMGEALGRQLDCAKVSFGYVPGFGSIFICEVERKLRKADEKTKELVRFLGPGLEVQDTENVCVIIKYENERGTGEYTIVAPREDIADVEKWTIFSSESQVLPQVKQVFENITPQEAHSLIQSYNQGCPCRRENFIILDVRTPPEYAKGHIKDAINLNYYSDNFKDKLDQLDKSKTYLVYCRSGHRSGKTLDIMEKLGFTKVYNLLGGVVQWEKEGLPTVK